MSSPEARRSSRPRRRTPARKAPQERACSFASVDSFPGCEADSALPLWGAYPAGTWEVPAGGEFLTEFAGSVNGPSGLSRYTHGMNDRPDKDARLAEDIRMLGRIL